MDQTKTLLKKMMNLIVAAAFLSAFFGIAMPVAEAIPNPIQKRVWYDENGLFHERTARYSWGWDKNRRLTGTVNSENHIWYDKNGYVHFYRTGIYNGSRILKTINSKNTQSANKNLKESENNNLRSSEEGKYLYEIPNKRRYWYDENGIFHLEEINTNERNQKNKTHNWYGKDGQKFEEFTWYDNDGHEHVSRL